MPRKKSSSVEKKKTPSASKPLRVAIVTCVYPPYRGGMGAVAYAHAHELARRGAHVRVITPQYERGQDSRVEEDGVHVEYRTPVFAYGNAGRIPVADLFETCDVVHLHVPFYFTAEVCATLAQRHPKVRFVVTYHMDPTASGVKGWYFRWYGTWVLPRILHAASTVFVSSRSYAESTSVAAVFRAIDAKVIEAPFGVDQQQFHPRTNAEESWSLLASTGLSPAKCTVLFVGGMDVAHAFKGVPVLLEAMRSLPDGVQLVLVGDGALRSHYERLVAKWRLMDRVRFVGNQSTALLAQWYRAAQVLVLPSVSRGEAFGLVLLEAMASGVACIASDLAGVRQVLDEGRAGIVVPPRNARALAEAVDSLYRDPVLRSTLVANAQTRVRRLYTWERMVDLYVLWYTCDIK